MGIHNSWNLQNLDLPKRWPVLTSVTPKAATPAQKNDVLSAAFCPQSPGASLQATPRASFQGTPRASYQTGSLQATPEGTPRIVEGQSASPFTAGIPRIAEGQQTASPPFNDTASPFAAAAIAAASQAPPPTIADIRTQQAPQQVQQVQQGQYHNGVAGGAYHLSGCSVPWEARLCVGASYCGVKCTAVCDLLVRLQLARLAVAATAQPAIGLDHKQACRHVIYTSGFEPTPRQLSACLPYSGGRKLSSATLASCFPAGSSPSSSHASIDGRADGMFGSAPPTPHYEPAVVHQQPQTMPLQPQAMHQQETVIVQQQMQVRGLWVAWHVKEGRKHHTTLSRKPVYTRYMLATRAHVLTAHALHSSRMRSALPSRLHRNGHDEGQLSYAPS